MAAALEHTVDSAIRGFHVYKKHLDCILLYFTTGFAWCSWPRHVRSKLL